MNQPSSHFVDAVFYVPGQHGRAPIVIDMAIQQADGNFVSRYSEKTFVNLSMEYPGLAIGELDTVIEEKENIYRREPPVEVTRERFQTALECLPPDNWVTHGDTESFAMCERTTGRITCIFARIGTRYFCFSDLFDLTHVEIVAKVNTAIAAGTIEFAQ